MYIEHTLFIVLAAINIWAYIVVAHDKRKAVVGNSSERTPEGLLFFMAVAFGSVGVYLAMLTFRHKTRTWYFQLGIPLLIIQNVATVYMVWQLLHI